MVYINKFKFDQDPHSQTDNDAIPCAECPNENNS